MSLVVFDMGQRIETPVRPLDRRINASQPTAESGAIDARHNPIGHAPSASHYQGAIQAYEKQQERAPATVAFIRDILHRDVKTLPPEATLADAWQLLEQSGHHNLPVVNSNRQVLAMFSEGNLLRALAKQATSPTAYFWQKNLMDFATRPVLCVQEQTDIHQTSKLLYEYNIGALPVLNTNNELCGIVTRSDILRILSHYGPLEFWA